jgi:hypothetical protein
MGPDGKLETESSDTPDWLSRAMRRYAVQTGMAVNTDENA